MRIPRLPNAERSNATIDCRQNEFGGTQVASNSRCKSLIRRLELASQHFRIFRSGSEMYLGDLKRTHDLETSKTDSGPATQQPAGGPTSPAANPSRLLAGWLAPLRPFCAPRAFCSAVRAIFFQLCIFLSRLEQVDLLRLDWRPCLN